MKHLTLGTQENTKLLAMRHLILRCISPFFKRLRVCFVVLVGNHPRVPLDVIQADKTREWRFGEEFLQQRNLCALDVYF